MDRDPDRNVVGGELLPCSTEPVTGFYRDGCCATGPEDLGSHTVCAVMTEEFLDVQQAGRERPLDAAPGVGFRRPAAGRPLVRVRLALARGLPRGRRRAGGARRHARAGARGGADRGADGARRDGLSGCRLLDTSVQCKAGRPKRRCSSEWPPARRRSMPAGVIETARLRLEPWDDSHFERFARFMRDPAVIRYIRAEPLDRASALEQHEHSLAEWEPTASASARSSRPAPTAGSASSSSRSSGRARARATTTSRSATSSAPTAGVRASPPRRRSPPATRRSTAAASTELIGRCRVENVASARVLAKVGFERLRLFELDDGIVVEIHRLQRADWRAPAGHGRAAHPRGGHATGAEYRETG